MEPRRQSRRSGVPAVGPGSPPFLPPFLPSSPAPSLSFPPLPLLLPAPARAQPRLTGGGGGPLFPCRPGSYFRTVQFTNDIRDSTLKAGTHDSSMDTWSAEEPRLKLPSTFKAESKLETFDTTVSREVLAAMKKQQERSASEKLLNTAGAALQWKLRTSRSRKEAKADLPPIVHQTFRSREHQRMFSIGSIGVTAPDVRTIISQKDLETFGIPSATLDKVYRLVELYTVGFQNLLLGRPKS